MAKETGQENPTLAEIGIDIRKNIFRVVGLDAGDRIPKFTIRAFGKSPRK